ncbi:MAG: glutamate--tRNA ligase [Halothiobacillaceae bacterium]|nr:glutamate--tRNA ligase [Halothiobacillaceae bacterium]
MKTRFAPSPTGYLHVGNVRTALFSWLLSRRHGGRFLLRIEDTDHSRSSEAYTRALMEDLAWLGLSWEEGPEAGGDAGPYRQSDRHAIYDRFYADLEARGLAYPCYCSEMELKLSRNAQLAAGRPPRYPGTCARLSEDEREARVAAGLRPTLRFRVPTGQTVSFEDSVRGLQKFASEDIGDFIIRRADGTPAFFFCNAVDDALMGVTHVLRGEDHLTNTPRQILLLEALGLPVPRYGHISLITGPDGGPLSKRDGSTSVRELKAEGYLPMAVNNYLARLGHSYAETGFMTLDALAAGFEEVHLGRSPARHDPAQLGHWQKEAVRAAGDDALLAWLGAELFASVPEDKRAAFLSVVRENVTTPRMAYEWREVLFGAGQPMQADARALLDAAPADFCAQLRVQLADNDDYKSFSKALQQATGLSGKALFMPLRAALTGRLDGPALGEIHALMAPETRLARVEAAIQGSC